MAAWRGKSKCIQILCEGGATLDAKCKVSSALAISQHHGVCTYNVTVDHNGRYKSFTLSEELGT